MNQFFCYGYYLTRSVLLHYRTLMRWLTVVPVVQHVLRTSVAQVHFDGVLDY